MQKSLTLYSFAVSPYAQKVRCFLLYKGVPFTTHYVDPVHMRRELPLGQMVPVLTYDGEHRNESSAIGLWLDELFPEQLLVPTNLSEQIMQADEWVSNKLVPLVFRVLIGFGEPIKVKARKRWAASAALNNTVPVGYPLPMRFIHLIALGRASMIKRLLKLTDTNKSNFELRQQLGAEFKALLGDGPFLCGHQQPTLADLAAFPQIAFPMFRDDENFLLIGDKVNNWVAAMYEAAPALHNFVPEELR